MTANPYQYGAVPLAGIEKVATWQRCVSPTAMDVPFVVISERCSVEEGAYWPAASITLFGRDQLLALRGAIDEALKDGESPSA